jgi:hypothetical protein
MIDAENFLHHDQAALRRALRIGAIGAERVFVGRGERELPAQVNLPLQKLIANLSVACGGY